MPSGLPAAVGRRNGCSPCLSDCSDSAPGARERRPHSSEIRNLRALPTALRSDAWRRLRTRRILDARPYGRRAFLAVTALGLSSLAWGRPAWRAVSGATSPLTDALPQSLVPSSGWRIYTVAASMPRFDPATWRLHVDGLVGSPRSLRIRRSSARFLAQSRSPPFTASRAGRSRTCTGPECGSRPSSTAVEAQPARTCAQLRVGREAVRRHAHRRPGAAPRRDAGLRDGRQAAAPGARGAAAARDPGDVRLQERQVGRADHAQRARRRPATGSSAATTRMRGSVARTASEPGFIRRFSPHRAGAALGARERLLRASRDRPDPVRPVSSASRSAVGRRSRRPIC